MDQLYSASDCCFITILEFPHQFLVEYRFDKASFKCVVSLAKKDGWTIIFINESLCKEQQREVYAHKMLYVLNGHLGQYNYQQCKSEVQILVKKTEFVFE